MPVPYEASLLLAFQEAAISAEAFGDALGKDVASIVNQDILAGYGRITITPTYVLYRVAFKDGKEGEKDFVYVLFEHKSSPDPFTSLQLLRYMLEIWELFKSIKGGVV